MHKINSLYIHYPHCRHLCNYCDFYKTKIPYPVVGNSNDQDIKVYTDAHVELESKFTDVVQKHQKFITKHDSKFEKLETVYIGGGTPSLWGESGAKFLQKTFNQNQISLSDDCEFTLEVNPGTWTNTSLDAFKSIGVNRFSIGLQSLEDRFLKILDRVHSREESLKTLKYMKEHDENYSIDFMIGLPDSEKLNRDIKAELLEVLSYKPKHISLYILTVPKHYKHFDKLPSEEVIEKEYLLASDVLRSQGFNHYEVSNFALPGLESRHNLKYWNQSSVAAWGPSATGYLAKKHLRYKWQTSKNEVQIEKLNENEVLTEKLFLKLRLSRPFNISEVEVSHHCEKLQKYIDQNLLKFDGQNYHQTPEGFLLMDSIVLDLMKQ